MKKKVTEIDFERFKSNMRGEYDRLYRAHYELVGKYARLMDHLNLTETIEPQKIVLSERKGLP
jgi:hypothetical protein